MSITYCFGSTTFAFSPSSKLLPSYLFPKRTTSSIHLANYHLPKLLNSKNDGLILSNTNSRFRRLRANDINAPNWGDHGNRWLDSARNLFDKLPEPLKIFPWNSTLVQFFKIQLQLAVSVAKYLFIPFMVLSTRSELIYCFYENKVMETPVPFLAGIAIATAFYRTVMDITSAFKEQAYPWHLLLMLTFFLLLKLPGPHYPYVGRIIVPHFANGGIWTTLWFAFQWYRNSSKTLDVNEKSPSQCKSDE
ncbi:hypothetical protein ZOSMA_49G00680 [Zostera marina]|uniref:Uncharacterized protein n=1 Tax=Zostera marina TaxID=29655 RepID=A0A0K9P1B6_ZOSMR|nr:hypothetical protein ZOSMA_49G00680 [Zostera marina]